MFPQPCWGGTGTLRCCLGSRQLLNCKLASTVSYMLVGVAAVLDNIDLPFGNMVGEQTFCFFTTAIKHAASLEGQLAGFVCKAQTLGS